MDLSMEGVRYAINSISSLSDMLKKYFWGEAAPC
jgi:hypothetical protein